MHLRFKTDLSRSIKTGITFTTLTLGGAYTKDGLDQIRLFDLMLYQPLIVI